MANIAVIFLGGRPSMLERVGILTKGASATVLSFT
jgi:hypothetical protein